MNYQEKLEKLLDKYLEESKQRVLRYKECILLKDLYEELIKMLNENYETVKDNKLAISLYFTSIYKDNVYLDEFYNLLVNLGNTEKETKRYKKLVSDITNDYKEILEELQTIKNQIERNKFLVSSANRAKICFKYNMSFNENKYDIPNIKKIISYYEMSGLISNKEELLLINEIETYNRRITSIKSETEHAYAETIYSEIPNIVNAGFQNHDEIEVLDNRKQTIEKFIKEIFDYISFLDDNMIIDTISQYKNYNLEVNEFNYLIRGVLDKYLDELLTFYSLLIDKEIYTNRKDRVDIIKNYYFTLNRYLLIRDYYEKINTIEESDEENEEVLKDIKPKRLIYSHTSKVRMLSDMKDIPYEYYKKTLELLTEFKKGTISKKEIKTLKGISNYRELKYDQIRIVYTHIKDNIYCIKGIATKKDDNDMTMYRTMINRSNPDISTEEKLQRELEISEKTENDLLELVNTKSRKGTR